MSEQARLMTQRWELALKGDDLSLLNRVGDEIDDLDPEDRYQVRRHIHGYLYWKARMRREGIAA